jgi:hypothetical protein
LTRRRTEARLDFPGHQDASGRKNRVIVNERGAMTWFEVSQTGMPANRNTHLWQRGYKESIPRVAASNLAPCGIAERGMEVCPAEIRIAGRAIISLNGFCDRSAYPWRSTSAQTGFA